jgi:two-component system response regulator DevR
MIRILILDRHPALRAGVRVVVEAERDLVVVGDTGVQEELLPLLRRTRPDVVLLDCHAPTIAGPSACRVIKGLLPAPRVLIYAAHADRRMRVAARVAGADGLLDKNSSALDLVRAIRVPPQRPPAARTDKAGRRTAGDAAARPQEARILELLLEDQAPLEIALALNMSRESVGGRVSDILDRLCVEARRTAADPCAWSAA